MIVTIFTCLICRPTYSVAANRTSQIKICLARCLQAVCPPRKCNETVT